MRERLWIVIASLSGIAAINADAVAAHVVSDGPAAAGLIAGARYGLVHALALLGVALLLAMRGQHGRAGLASHLLQAAGWFFAAGLLLFPGSLYLLAAGASPAFGRAAPVGGMLFMAGWLMLLVYALAPRPAGET